MNSQNDGRVARGDLRRELLLDSAVRVVAELGSGALTHRAVATEAGVSVASVTYHFPSIVDLRNGMFDHAGSRIGLAFRALIEQPPEVAVDVPEIAGRFAVQLVTEKRTDAAAVFEMIVAAGHDETLRPLVLFFNERLAELLAPYVGRQFDALLVASAIQGIILGYIAHAIDDLPALHDAVADLVRRYHHPAPTRS